MSAFANQWHKDRETDEWYIRVGSGRLFERDAIEFWALMVGEEAIKEFVKKCEKDGWGNYVAELKAVKK